MRMFLAIAVAAAATGVAVTGNAAQVCQWTGHDWACGDGNVVTSHRSVAEGPDMIVVPTAAPRLPPGEYLPNVYGPQPR